MLRPAPDRNDIYRARMDTDTAIRPVASTCRKPTSTTCTTRLSGTGWWTHPRTALPDEVVDRDRLLTNVMLYWRTGTAGSAAAVVYAGGEDGAWGEPVPPSGVPTGVIVFAHDVGIRRYVERDHHVVRWTDVDRGGHFAALEEPELLVDDVRAFFRALR